jgi:CDP-4-dehydro-6-deoxyglucose reductase
MASENTGSLSCPVPDLAYWHSLIVDLDGRLAPMQNANKPSPVPHTCRVTLLPQQREFTAVRGETVLGAALRAGLNLPHSCKGGSCGLCLAKVLSGQIAYPFGRPVGLSADDAAQGYALLCEAHARGDLDLDLREIQLAGQAAIRRLPCRVARKQLLAPDVMALFLRLPAVERLTFLPGQYLDIMLPGERRRSFSIACPPHDSNLLELHVRRTPGGEFSQRVFDDLPEQSLLQIEGPLGQFCYRHDPRPPAILIGGGTGFAPLKSIIRHVLENKLNRRMHLYWGARTAVDLYQDTLVKEWARAHGNFSYTPVLSEPGPGWNGRIGLVHAAAFADHPDLSRIEVYAGGPPEMIEAIRRDGEALGLAPGRLHFDSFEYAPDALEKMRRAAGAAASRQSTSAPGLDAE